MPSTYILARDHLEQAASILRGDDTQTKQLRTIVERTIALMNEFQRDAPSGPERRPGKSPGNVLDFEAYRDRSHRI